MAAYVEYSLDNDNRILIEVGSIDETGIVKAARNDKGNVIIQASQKFEDALQNIRRQASVLQRTFDNFVADEVEIKFSLTVSGELGLLTIGKFGAEANYEVTLKWKNENGVQGERKAVSDVYVGLARKTLDVLEVDYSEEEGLELLLTKIRSAMVLVASETEGAIQTLNNQIIREIQNQSEEKVISDLIQQLNDEVTFLPHD